MRNILLGFMLGAAGTVAIHPALADIIVPGDAVWRYLDDGTDQGTAWKEPGFDDSGWASGPAELGYGDGDEATVLSFGGDPDNKITTYYFRHTFPLEDASEWLSGSLQLLRDDGAIVYLNGTEIWRSNMPAGDVAFDTFAASTAGTSTGEERTFFTGPPVDPSLLVTGDNVLAVEVHQVNLTSSDISLALVLELSRDAPGVDMTPPSIQSVTPSRNATVSSLTRLTVRFTENVTGIGPGVLLVNGEPVNAVTGDDGVFTFSFNQPPPGFVQVIWDVDHGIVDAAGNRFDDGAPSATWTYDLVDTVAPVVARATPAAGATILGLTELEVLFSEPVGGVDAGDLRVAGMPALSVTGSGAGPYHFQVPEPDPGTVNVTWDPAHGIADLSPQANAFGGSAWFYEVNPSANRSVVLNEILARNLTSIRDEDDQKNDWIKLHNRGAEPVRLLGWSLSDDPEDPDRWRLPDLTLDAGGYLVIIASGKDRKTTDPQGFNHTNFRLDVDGGFLGLHAPGLPAEPVDAFAPSYPELRGDISYGRRADQTLAWFSRPTPGMANADGAALEGIVLPPHASVDSGLFDRPFDLVLSTETAGARIFYSLDGSVPTQSSPEYFGPIRIEGHSRQGAVIVRAAAFRPGRLSSLVTTRTYIFPEHVLTQPADPEGFPDRWISPGNLNDSEPDYEMDPEIIGDTANNYAELAREGLGQIPTLSIVTDPEKMWSPEEGYYVRKTFEDDSTGTPLIQPCNAELIIPDGSEAGFNVDAGVRIVGGTSPNNQGSFWKSRKLSMRLVFRGDFGNTKLHHQVFPDSPVDRFDTLVVDAGLNYVWSYNGGSNPDDQRLRAQYVRDQYVSDLQNALGGTAPHGRFVHVYLNGLYWGLHDLHERPDESFAAEYLGGDGDDYDSLKHNASSVLNGSNADYLAMIQMARSGLADNANFLALQAKLDVPAFIDYMMANFWVGNTDWAHQNWYASRHQSVQGRWRFHSWDAEHVMKSTSENRLNRNDSNGPTELFQLLRQSPEFRLQFADHVRRHFFNGGVFYTDPVNPEWNPAFPERNRPAALWMRRIDEVAPGPIVAESARWGDTGQTGTPRADNPLTYGRDFLDELDALMGRRSAAGHASSYNYFPQRSSIVLGQFQSAGLYPSLAAPEFSQHGGRVAAGFSLGMLAPDGGTIYYTTNETDPRIFGSGAVSSQAIEYLPGEPPLLNGSTVVKARVLSGQTWSALTEASFVVEDLQLPIRITEIMYHPIGDEDFEFLELLHVGGTALDLSGHTLDGVDFTFPVGSFISPGTRLVLANNNNPAAFASRYPGVTVFGTFGGSLANGGEQLTLRDPQGTHLLSVEYDDENGWPLEADGLGPSLEIVDPMGNASDPANWVASGNAGGSPGLPNPTPPEPLVRISEILASNLGSVDHEGTLPDYIELHNPGGADVDLSGWSLSDRGLPGQFVFPPTTQLPAGGFLLVWADAITNTTSGFHAGFSLNQDGEGVFLYDDTGRRIDAVTFGLLPADHSMGRMGGDWILSNPTPLQANTSVPLADVSELVLNEWMAHPLPGDDDWIELYNRSTQHPLALRGIYLGSGDAVSQIQTHAWLPPGGFLQLFAEERTGPDQLDFRLTASGGDIVLYDATGLERERVLYGPQAEGVSSGRLPDGNTSSVEIFAGSASPEASNYLLDYDGPILSEVLARNRDAIPAPWGAFADYVELWNGGATTFDLSGMGLSRADADEVGFVFPPGTEMGPEDYLVVWWDGSRLLQTNDSSMFNAGQNLAGQAGGVLLLTAQGQLADRVDYGFQVPNQPIGRIAGQWRLLEEPSPAMANTEALLGDPSGLKLNEWMADPVSGDDWFEVHNTGSLPVSLSGLHLTDDPSLAGRSKFTVAPLSFIGPGGFVDWEADGRPGRGANHVNFSLNRAGETLLLCRSDRSPIDTIHFGLQRPGASQGRLPDGTDAIVTFDTTPTPGASNFLPLETLVLNEALSHTDPPLEDAIEIRNLGAVSADIGGWWLSDGQGQFMKYQIPTGTIVAPGGFWVAYEQDLTGGAGSQIPFALDSVRGDEVWLAAVDDQGNLTGRRARASFGAAANGVSFGRWQTSVGVDFPPQVQRTLGADDPATLTEFRSGQGLPNAGPLVGPVVINELMYHPPDFPDPTVEEYIELFNITDQPVALYDPAFPENTWRLEGGVDFAFPPMIVVPPRAYLIVVGFDPETDPDAVLALRSRYGLPGELPILGPYQGQLGNGGDTLRLLRPDTPQMDPGPDAGVVPMILVGEVTYGEGYPWPSQADGLGASLQRRRPHDYGNDPVNWKGEAPTPGRANVAGHGFADSDQDGMPDDYETANGLDPTNPADASADVDGDGDSSYLEFLQGTLPGDINSVLSPPTIVRQPQDTTTVPGMPAVLDVAADGSSPLFYQWYRNGVAVPGGTLSRLELPFIGTRDGGSYHVAVWNGAGFEVSRSAELVVNIPPRITAHPQSQTLSNGLEVSFSVSAIGTGTLQYQWRLNGQDISGATSRTLVISDVQLEQAGQYTVVVTDDLASTVSEAATLKVLQAPEFIRHPVSQTVVEGSDVIFTVHVRATLPVTYRWRKGFATLKIENQSSFVSSVRLGNVTTNDSGSRITCVATNEVFFRPGELSQTAILTVLPDRDGDGIDDDYESRTPGLDPDNPTDGDLDSDGDGMSNREEYEAGTDPNDDQSWLRVAITRLPGGGPPTVLLNFRAEAGKSYSVQHRESAGAGPWQKLIDVELETTARMIEVTDPAPLEHSRRVYRLVTPKTVDE